MRALLSSGTTARAGHVPNTGENLPGRALAHETNLDITRAIATDVPLSFYALVLSAFGIIGAVLFMYAGRPGGAASHQTNSSPIPGPTVRSGSMRAERQSKQTHQTGRPTRRFSRSTEGRNTGKAERLRGQVV